MGSFMPSASSFVFAFVSLFDDALGKASSVVPATACSVANPAGAVFVTPPESTYIKFY